MIESQGWRFAVGICADLQRGDYFRLAADAGAEFFLLCVAGSGMPDLVGPDGDQTKQAEAPPGAARHADAAVVGAERAVHLLRQPGRQEWAERGFRGWCSSPTLTASWLPSTCRPRGWSSARSCGVRWQPLALAGRTKDDAAHAAGELSGRGGGCAGGGGHALLS